VITPQIEDYEDKKGPELVEHDCVFFVKLEGMIEELKMWKFDKNYSEEEVIVGYGDDEVSEMTGCEWERQGEQDPDEELSDLNGKYLLESMMAEENEVALLGKEESGSGEEPSTFDPEDSEVHSEEYGESNGHDSQSGGAALGRSKQTIKAPGRLIDEKNVLCVEKMKRVPDQGL
jgi:hypothetical protein